MIKSAIGFKAKVRNLSKGDSKVAQTLIRIFFMERFLERISLSKYRDKFVLKGGILISSLIGVDLRSTMDIDTTVKALPLTQNELKKIIMEICEIPLEDNILFKIIDMETIMDGFDYPGIRIHMEALLEKMWNQFKNKNYFVEDIEYSAIIKTISDTIMNIYH